MTQDEMNRRWHIRNSCQTCSHPRSWHEIVRQGIASASKCHHPEADGCRRFIPGVVEAA